jgi:ribosomal protein L3 glutamine methyltransferase
VNAYRLGSRVHPVRSDLFDALPGRRYDLIVANPPYVDAKSMKKLPAEYRHEPRRALAGGEDGLRFVRRILERSAAFLRPRGLLVVEIGRHRRELERAFPATPFIWPEAGAGTDLVFMLNREDLPPPDRESLQSGAKTPKAETR